MSVSVRKSLFAFVRIIIGAILLVLLVYPVFYVIMSSMKTLNEFQRSPSYALPASLNFSNYIKVFTTSQIANYFKNSLIIAVTTVVLLLLLASLAAFALCKIKFKGNKFLYTFFMLGLMLPFQVAMIPLFFMFSKVHILNTYAAVIIPQAAFSLSYSTMLFYSFYKFLPNDVIESGIIDGCSPLGCFFRIVAPMSLNSFLTVATLQFVFCWNDFICAYTFTRSTVMKTITLGLNDFVGMYGLTDWGATFAAVAVTVLPTFIFYFITSKYMMSGLTAGAVKG